MGATGEVTVQTIWLWEDDRDESLKKLNARLEKEQRERDKRRRVRGMRGGMRARACW